MALYGVLKSATNTGADYELSYVFSTPLSIASNQPVFSSDTLNLRRRRSSNSAQRWEIEAAIAPTNDSPNLLIHSVLNGYSATIFVRMPQIPRAVETPSGKTLTLNGGASKGTDTINVSGLGSSNLAEGEFIRFTGDPKVYLVTASGVNGTGVKIYPDLRVTLSNGAGIAYGAKCTMNAVYDDSAMLGIKFSDGILTDQGTIRFVEDIV